MKQCTKTADCRPDRHVQVEPGKWMPVFDFARKVAAAARCGAHP